MEDECSRTFLIMVVKLVVPIMISLTVAVNASNALPNDPPIIEIGDGKLMGSFQHSVSGKLHSAFLGIPFAQPPVGSLRFRPPIKNEPWNGIRNATNGHNWCVQIWFSGLIGDEDCLYLNVYTPYTNFTEVTPDLPVMVYFHGGAFIFAGASIADGYFLLEHEVVLVSVDYRQGPFGFLSLNTSEVSGNQGLRDQQLALRWVSENIGQFGGNPDKVTIFGQSAGSWSVTHHLVAPGSKNLFSQAIAQSGSIYGGLCLIPNSAEKAARQGLFFAEYVGCRSHTLQCLQNLTVEDIGYVPFLPRGSVDGHLNLGDPVLPADPELLFEAGEFHRVPLVIGTTDMEGIIAGEILHLLGLSLEAWTLAWPILGPLMVAEKFPHQITQADIDVAYHVKDFYLHSQAEAGAVFTHENLKEAMEMITDSLFLYSTHKTARTVAKYVPEVYQYIFSRNANVGLINAWNDLNVLGVSHADDLWFNFNPGPDSGFSNLDFEVARIYTAYFYNFALTGDPNFDAALDQWEKVSPVNDYGYLNIGDNVTMIYQDHRYQERMEFWQDLFDSLV